MSILNTLLSSLLGSTNPTTTTTSSTLLSNDKIFKKSEFDTVFTRSDADNNGHLTLTELKNLVNSDARYVDVNYDAAKVLLKNFQAVADRATKKGESVTAVWNANDNTIEAAEIKKLAGFDGDANNITKTDVSRMNKGDTSNWPQNTTTPPTNTNDKFIKLLKLLIQLLLGGQNNTPGPNPLNYPYPVTYGTAGSTTGQQPNILQLLLDGLGQ